MKKSKKNKKQVSRRSALKFTAGAASTATALSMVPSSLLGVNQSKVNEQDEDQKFLIVLTNFGGGSINDSFLALSEDEVRAAGGDPEVINCYKDSQLVAVDGTPFKAVKLEHTMPALGNFQVVSDQSEFLRRHKQDITVVTSEGTSVNHGIAQQRSVNGNEAWAGRTIQEVAASFYGQGFSIPNMNMGSGGYAFDGGDSSLESYARGMSVSNPLYWPLSLSSSAKVSGVPSKAMMDLARDFRLRGIESQSNFMKTFKDDPKLSSWLNHREKTRPRFEQENLFEKLFFLDGAGDAATEKAKAMFPRYNKDTFDAQAIMSYLAITKGVSSVVTLGPNSSTSTSDKGIYEFYNIPIAFDFSHNDHRGAQAHMWQRMLRVTDGLIELLKATPYGTKGESYWDKTMIYMASDFGRSKTRPAGSEVFGSAHDLNNASVLISPMLKGNRVIGGIDPKTALTYGFDPVTGSPDRNKKTSEKEFYSVLTSALDIDGSAAGLPDFRKIVKK